MLCSKDRRLQRYAKFEMTHEKDLDEVGMAFLASKQPKERRHGRWPISHDCERLTITA